METITIKLTREEAGLLATLLAEELERVENEEGEVPGVMMDTAEKLAFAYLEQVAQRVD